MLVTWDEDVQAMYLAMGDEARPAARTVELDSGTLVDLDQFDVVVGVEVINPRRPLPIDKIMHMHVPDSERAVLADYLGALSSQVEISGTATRVDLPAGPRVAADH